jgi:3-deoxy-D-manno-octulosonate 8-phosphate phosphatase (KDO 8-P phosphatase)
MKHALDAGRARRIRFVALDVDGVLTDGGLYMGATAEGVAVEMKRFDITDQLGVKMLGWAGLDAILLTGRGSSASKMRAKELGIPYYEGPGGYKVAVLEEVLAERGVSWDETACVCDDLADVPILRKAGLAVAVANAVPEVRAIAHWTTTRPGGHGAVREFVETLLHARGEWNERVREYHAEREKAAP